jgi:hypothetical protein
MDSRYKLLEILDKFLGSGSGATTWRDLVVTDRRAGIIPTPSRLRVAQPYRIISGNVRLLFTEKTIFRVAAFPVTWPGRTYDINTLGYKIQYVNFLTRGANIRTKLKDRVGVVCKPPNGLHVFERIAPIGDLRAAIVSLKTLFRLVEHGRNRDERADVVQFDGRFQMREYQGEESPNNILFISDKKEQLPVFSECMKSLLEYDITLYNFVDQHAKLCLYAMGVDSYALDSCQLQLIHYIPRGGILAHIDNVTVFGDTVGPIFTVNMNAPPKAFDLLPTLLSVGTDAIRLTTLGGQVTMMDGESRLLWSHSIPSGNPDHCYTIAFKFPCMEIYKHDVSGGYSAVLDTHIPQNLNMVLRND